MVVGTWWLPSQETELVPSFCPTSRKSSGKVVPLSLLQCTLVAEIYFRSPNFPHCVLRKMMAVLWPVWGIPTFDFNPNGFWSLRCLDALHACIHVPFGDWGQGPMGFVENVVQYFVAMNRNIPVFGSPNFNTNSFQLSRQLRIQKWKWKK